MPSVCFSSARVGVYPTAEERIFPFFDRRFPRRAFWAIMLLVAIASQPARAQPAGILHEAITCEEQSEQSYALYLPSGYSPDRPWPIVYCFDPRAWGRVPVERLQAAAERFGFILVGSNNSMNGSWEGNVTAARAMFEDTHQRFAIDEHRIYAAGFSGGARVACEIAANWHMAGVLASGASFPGSVAPAEVPFVFYGCVGRRDFNYGEMKRVDESLERMRVPHRVVFHDGGHDWIPVSMAEEALGWFELQAMRVGRRPVDNALIGALYEERMNSIRASRQDAEVYFLSLAIAADFNGFLDVSVPAGNVARLKDSDAVKKFLKAEIKDEKQEKRFLERLAEAAAAPPRVPQAESRTGFSDGDRFVRGDPFSTRSDGGADSFRRERESRSDDWARAEASRLAAIREADPHEVLREVAASIQNQARGSVAAFRALHCFAGMLQEQGFAAEKAGELQKAMLAFELSTIVGPDSGWAYLGLARICARTGAKEKGRAALQEARKLGFPDQKRIAEMEALLAP
jgi:dienelactone hydrolase